MSQYEPLVQGILPFMLFGTGGLGMQQGLNGGGYYPNSLMMNCCCNQAQELSIAIANTSAQIGMQQAQMVEQLYLQNQAISQSISNAMMSYCLEANAIEVPKIASPWESKELSLYEKIDRVLFPDNPIRDWSERKQKEIEEKFSKFYI